MTFNDRNAQLLHDALVHLLVEIGVLNTDGSGSYWTTRGQDRGIRIVGLDQLLAAAEDRGLLAAAAEDHCEKEEKEKEVTLTDLEAEVAWLVRKGRDPWQAMQGVGGSSRRVSQTLGRLQRKGAVARLHTDEGSKWTLTPEGSSALDARGR